MQPGALIAERFRIERRAASGGMGTVYRALDQTTGDVVALKVLGSTGEADAQRFAREARALAELRHPAIVRYVAHGSTSAGDAWLAMEWLEGEDLAARLTREGLSIADGLAVAARMADALALLHRRDVVHRDVKPSNIFLVRGEVTQAKLLDLGVAFVGRATLGMTRTGMLLGTPAYMSPEQAQGSRGLDGRSDMFSLGCVLFECVTGRPAFPGDHALAILAQIILGPVPRARALRPDLPAALDELLASLLAKSPDDRPSEMGQVATMMRSVLDLGSPSMRRVSGPRAPTALTEAEQFVASVVVTASPGASIVTSDALTRPALPAALLASLRLAVEPYGARIDPLFEGVVATVLGDAAATDLAARAARCALAMRALLPDQRVVVSTGRAQLRGVHPVGDAVDRAAAILRDADARTAPLNTLLDEATAALLGTSFEVRREGTVGTGHELVHEHEPLDPTRPLLGKPTPFVGREADFNNLEGVFRACVEDDSPRVVLITGEAGSGKSRLRHELLRKLRTEGNPLLVLEGRGDSVRAGSPFHLLGPPIRRLAGILEDEPAELRQRKLSALVGRSVADPDRRRVSEFLGELVGVPFPTADGADSIALRVARDDAVTMADQMRRAFTDWLCAECARQPVMLVMEDLHWSDQPSVQFVDAALRTLTGSPLMVVALARPEVEKLLPRIWQDRGLQVIRLRPLSRRASERLVRTVLGAALSAHELASIVAQADGNAFYLEELIRAVHSRGVGALPESVLVSVQTRLSALPADARRVLRAASVFGTVFWRGGVEALLGGDTQGKALARWLDDLERHELVSRLPDARFGGEVELGFRHAIVRDAAYDMLTDDDRVLGHRLAAGWLSSVSEPDARVVADHFERGGDREHALDWHARAGQQALDANDYRGALARFERGIACGAEGETLGAMRLSMAEARKCLGEFAEAAREAESATVLLPRGSAAWCDAVHAVIPAASAAGDLETTRRFLELLAGVEPAPDATLAYVRACHAAVTEHTHDGRAEEGASVLAHMIALSQRTPEPAMAPWVSAAKATVALFRGDLADYLRNQRSVADGFARTGAMRRAAGERLNAAFGYYELGAYEEAERMAREALADAARLGMTYVESLGKLCLCSHLLRQARYEEARSLVTAALQDFVSTGDARMEGCARIYLAELLEGQGEAEAALREAQRAKAILEKSPPLLPYALGTLCRLHLSRGNVPLALQEGERADERIRELGSAEEGEAIARLAHAEALFAAGRTDDARGAIQAAREKILARADQIDDPGLRASFLERVRENARVLERAAAWVSC